MEALNDWFIYLDSLTISMLSPKTFSIVTFVSLLLAYFLVRKLNKTEYEHQSDLMAFSCIFFFVIGTLCNIIYAFYMSPEHYLAITKMILFASPYLGLIVLSIYLNLRDKR